MFVTDVILCEDVRLEEGGKTSLIGVFGDKINVNLPPGFKKPDDFKIQLRLGACFKVFIEETEPRFPNLISFQLHSGEEDKLDVALPIPPQSPSKLMVIRILPKMLTLSESTKLNLAILLSKDGEELYRYELPYEVDVLFHELTIPQQAPNSQVE